jgi:polyferredoxin/plastocyanin
MKVIVKVSSMRKVKNLSYLLVTLTLILSFGFYLLPIAEAQTSPRVIELTAKQFAFNPETIKVRVGEKVIFKVTSIDVTHGFYIDGHKIFMDIPPGQTINIGPIKFDRPGKFKIRCATICGSLHPFMVADVIVEPNIPFHTFTLLSILVGIGSLIYVNRARSSDKLLGISLSKEIDLLKLKFIGPILTKLVKWRGYHFFIILPNALIFMIVLTTGFFGNPTGALNFSIAVVWILWFAAVEFMIFFGSRFWCSLCPLPAFGEWLARRRLYSVHEPRKWLSLNRVFPRNLRNMWIPALGFLGISLIIPWLVTRPVVTGILFLLLILGGLILHLIYKKRHFCLSICPASGYIGYHSAASIFAVRSRDESICNKCVVKGCIRGTPKGYGCPWERYPGGNDINTYCGLDFECLKACPLNNMTLKLRMVAKDIATKIRTRADEAWMGFIRFTLAIFYELVFFGPYFWIKDWGNMGVPFGANLLTIGVLLPSFQGFRNWTAWALIVTLVSLVIFPAVFLAFTWLAKKASGNHEVPIKQAFLALSNTLAPYGLLLWMAFAIGLVGINWAYPLRAFSDPLGWGWNILGTGKIEWKPFIPDLLPYIQSIFVFFGLALAINCTYKISLNLFKEHKRALRATLIMSILHVGAAIVFIWLLMG